MADKLGFQGLNVDPVQSGHFPDTCLERRGLARVSHGHVLAEESEKKDGFWSSFKWRTGFSWFD